MFCRAPLADMVTAPGKVFVNPWSAPPPGELTAPETNRVSCAALRPLSGNSVRRCCSITCLRMDVVVSTCVSPLFTVTVSVDTPSFNCTFTVNV